MIAVDVTDCNAVVEVELVADVDGVVKVVVVIVVETVVVVVVFGACVHNHSCPCRSPLIFAN